jgi:hypothetical protein
MKKRHEKVI